jgi:hypothetical protein
MVDDRNTPIYVIINDEARAVGVKLTDGAREMLAIPVMEQYTARWKDNEWRSVRSSVHRIIDEAKRTPRHTGERTGGKLNSRAIIRGFLAGFCNIPPFCAAVEPRRRP